MNQVITRRDALKTGLFSLSGLLMSDGLKSREMLGAPAQRALFLIHLKGGNDALNTVIPYSNRHYYMRRPTLAVPSSNQVPICNNFAFPKTLAALEPLYRQGLLSIYLGAGYAQPSKSHHRSTQIWKSGITDRISDRLWLIDHLERFKKNAAGYKTESQSSSIGHLLSNLRNRLDTIKIEFTVTFSNEKQSLTVVAAELDGFDTHANQRASHNEQLEKLGLLLEYLHCPSRRTQYGITSLVFSEFGRSIDENHECGTDHGAAGLCLLTGDTTKGGIYGSYRGIEDYRQEELGLSVDFREIYASTTRGLFV